MALRERECDGYQRQPHEGEYVRHVGHGIYFCDDCFELSQINHSQDGRFDDAGEAA